MSHDMCCDREVCHWTCLCQNYHIYVGLLKNALIQPDFVYCYRHTYIHTSVQKFELAFELASKSLNASFLRENKYIFNEDDI